MNRDRVMTVKRATKERNDGDCPIAGRLRLFVSGPIDRVILHQRVQWNFGLNGILRQD